MPREHISLGGLPHYAPGLTPVQRMVVCIEHEMYHGGNYHAAASAILRDIRLGYIKVELPEQPAAAS